MMDYDRDEDSDDFDSPQDDRNQTQESSPPKLRRLPGSCDACRKVKVKCDRQGEGRCLRCISRDAECTRTILPRKPRAKRTDHVSTMANRIQQLESIITAAIASSRAASECCEHGQKSIERQMELSDNLSVMISNDQGTTRFVGASSGFSLFSKRGLEWITERTGTTNLDQLISQVTQLDPETWDRGSWCGFSKVSWSAIPPDQREPFPAKEVTMQYVDEFFFHFNAVFPIFSQKIFMERLERQYSDDPPRETAWYAALNAVLAIGCQILLMQHLQDQPPQPFKSTIHHSMEQEASKYCRNATGTFLDMQFGKPSVLAVQALVVMALMSPNPVPECLPIVLNVASWFGHSIGLHCSFDESRIPNEQARERRNLFWTLYVIDKHIAMQSGSPPIIHDQDIGVCLPEEESDVVLYPSGTRRFNTFVCTVKLALIQSRVYDDLYSARSRTKPVLQRLQSICSLDKELQKWREEVPIEIRPEHEILCDESQLIPVMTFHFAYYNCLTTMYRAALHHGPWNDQSVDEELSRHRADLDPRIYKSEAICVDAARNVIDILDYFDEERGPPIMWHIVSQPLCAGLILFVNILQHPESPYASSDLGRINLVVAMLGQWAIQAQLYFASGTLWVFYELYKIADELLTKVKEEKFQKDLEAANSELASMDQSSSTNPAEGLTRALSVSSSHEQKPLPPLPPLSYMGSYASSYATPHLTPGSVSQMSESQSSTPYSQGRIDFNEDRPIMNNNAMFDMMPYETWHTPPHGKYELPVGMDESLQGEWNHGPIS